MKPSNIFLTLILLIALFLRSYKLNSFPSLNPDEAALAYNAYSLLETGKDEHGASWPLHFKSFGDYKPGGYIYLALPFIKIFGLTPLAIRFPNLILSILTIYFLHKLVFLLTSKLKLSFLTAFILAVNPWHIHFSRGAWESSTALSFILIGTYFFYKFLKNNNLTNFLLFTFSFSLSLYFYHSARIIAPLLAFSYLILNIRHLIPQWKRLIIPSLIGLILILPVSVSFLRNGGATRFGGVGITADSGPRSRAEELLNNHMNVKLVNRIMHNKRVLYLLSWGQKYLSHFDQNFLFLNGDEVPRSKSPEMGQFYLFELPFLFLGIYYLIHKSYFINHKSFLLIWLFTSPLASSLTFQAPSALRALPMVIPLSILIALGLYAFLKKFHFFTVYCILFTVYLSSLSYFLDAYFVHAPKRYPFAWNTGFSELISYIESHKYKFENIYITDKYDQPYILYLFYSKYPPLKIQSQIKLSPPDQFGFSTVKKIDNIFFEKINWNSIPLNSLIAASDEFTPIAPLKTINFPNKLPGFKIYTK